MRNEQDAEDVVQEAALRAFRFFENFRGENSRAWFLRIVRNTSFTVLKKNRPDEMNIAFDEELHGGQTPPMDAGVALDRAQDRQSRSEEHTSELQSRQYLVCRLLLDKKKITI